MTTDRFVPGAALPDLKNRVALVTGAGRGVGRSLARQLATSGASVVVVARSADEIAETVRLIEARGGSAYALRADLADLSGVPELARRAADRFGTVDILINNAGTVEPLGATIDLDWHQVAATMVLNVLSPAALSAQLLPGMLGHGWGRIVNVSSGVVDRPRFMVGGNAYVISKSALEAHTLNLSAELDGSGVTANVYRPGSVDTAMQQFIRSQEPADATRGIVQRFRTAYASGALITPDRSAAALLSRLGTDDNGMVWDVADPEQPVG